MSLPPLSLASLTLVLGKPLQHAADFAEFQTRAASGASVAEHPWALHEHAALDALTHRAGPLGTHTLLETMLGGVLGVDVIVADVDRQWVRHADGDLYAALTLVSADVRPRAAAQALYDPALVPALNAVAASLATLDGRAWLDWSARRSQDESTEQTPRTRALMQALAEAVLAEAVPSETLVVGQTSADDDQAIDLGRDLREAIRLGRRAAIDGASAMVRELRDLRHVEPLRHEWDRVLMDAFQLGAFDEARLRAHLPEHPEQALPWLHVGKDRTDQLKADPYVTPRFHRELLARAFMTAYALERLAPESSALMARTLSAELAP